MGKRPLELINVQPNFVQALIISEQGILEMEVRTPGDIAELRTRFFLLFKKSVSRRQAKITIHRRQKNSEEIRRRVAEFVERYREELPVVNKLNDYFKSLPIGEWFEIVPYGRLADQMQQLKASRLIHALNTGQSFKKIWKDAQDEFGDIVHFYHLSSFNSAKGRKRRIGEPDKTKRICRFCNNSRGVTSFKNESHAISEVLGNKKIIQNEECDACNSFFGQGIEKELASFLRVYLTVSGIEGKNGSAKTKGENFELSNDEGILIEMTDVARDDKDLVRHLRLVTRDNVSSQNLYRCLSKFAIGVMDNEKLYRFRNTIEWINGESSKTYLPKVSMRVIPGELYKHPFLAIYESHDTQSGKPWMVAELRVSVLQFVFIVPSFTSEETDCTDEEAFQDYWRFFTYYSSQPGWSFVDFSNDISKQLVFNLTFDPETEPGNSEQNDV